MKYLYYALHLFYVKIIRVPKFWPPIIDITAVMALLIALLCDSVVYAFEDDMTNHQYAYYSLIVSSSLYLILYKVFYDYYKKKEAELLKEMDSKPLWVKILSALGSLCFIVLVVKLWMFDGMSDLYQFVKHQLFQCKWGFVTENFIIIWLILSWFTIRLKIYLAGFIIGRIVYL